MDSSPIVSSNHSPSLNSHHSFSPSNYHYHQQRNGHQQNHHQHRYSINSITESNQSHAPQTRIAELQEEYLIPMKEDLSDWLRAILDIDDLDANNFMSRLDNGVVVCKLAKLIEEKCDIDNVSNPNQSINNSTKSNHVYQNGQNSNLNGNQYSNNNNNNNNNNIINDIKNNFINDKSDPKANHNIHFNNNNIIYEESVNNNSKPPLNSVSGGDDGQYRSASCTFNHNGRRLSFNYNGSLNGHSPVNGSSSPSSHHHHFSTTNSPSSTTNGICARTMKCWENAKSETFYARDNVSNFIKWCRKLNVRECVLFESEDLVLHNNPKNVVLCLLEVARIACKKFMFTPAPGLVQFEQEIDAEERAELERERIRRRKRLQQQSMVSSLSTSKTPSNKPSTAINDNHVTINDKLDVSESNSSDDNIILRNNRNFTSTTGDNNNGSSGGDDNGNILIINNNGYDGNDGDDEDDGGSSGDDKCSERPDSVEITREGGEEERGQSSSDSGSINTGDDGVDGWSSVSQENLGRASSVTSISSTSAESTETQSSQAQFGQESKEVVSQLDQKVMLIAKSYYGKKAKHGIQRLAEGKYRIAGKIVFVRLLKDRHVMVRVGGGWDTLQHFLERHGNGSDPVKEISPSDLLPMDTRPSESMSRRRNSQSSQHSHQQSSVPSTPTLRRCLSSTPVSRSSLSSPEPWTSVGGGSVLGHFVPATGSSASPNGLSSSPSGYNNNAECSTPPYNYRSLARRSSACTTLSNITTASSSSATYSSTSSSSSTLNSTEKCVSPVVTSTVPHHPSSLVSPSSISHRKNVTPITRRRSLANDGLNNFRNSTLKSNRSMLSLNLTRSPSTSSHLNSSFSSLSSSRSFNTNSGNLINNSGSTTPSSTKTSRYPNYLQSSQHITSKVSGNSHHSKSSSTKSPTATSPTTPTSGPAAPLRRASLKAF